jgi:hypothetical protein
MFARVAGIQDASRSAPLSFRIISFVALRVSAGRSLASILGILNAEFPLPSNLPHVKRVKRLPSDSPFYALVLLCDLERTRALGGRVLECGRAVDVRDAASFSRVVALAQSGRAGDGSGADSAVCDVMGAADAEVVDVVAFAPADRLACETEAATVWPMVYFAPTVTAATTPSDSDALHFYGGLAAAARAAEEGSARGFAGVGAAVFSRDLEGNWVERARASSSEVARTESACAEENPFQSATLALIARIAAEDARSRASAASACDADAAPPRRSDAPSDRSSAAAGVKRRRASDGDGGAGGAVQELAAAARETAVAATKSDLTYLLTGCDVFLTAEPGVMDAMALVHARASRVIFSARAPPGSGALTGWGSACIRIHELHGLNHHFEAFERAA